MRSLLLLIPAVTVLVACTGTGSQSIRTEMEQTGCSPTALRGYGFAANGTDAQNEAYSQIATQIKSSVEFSSKSSKQMTVKNGDENVESSYLIENATMASISNAENVQVVYSKSGPEGVGVVACMERAAAAQPFVRMYESSRDSFNMEMGAASSEKHPLKFATAVKNAMRLYNQMVQSREVVENLEQGVKFAGDLPAAKDANDKLVEFFQQFKKDYSVTIAEDSSTLDASVSVLLRETLMNMNKFDGSDKPRGIRLLVSAGEMKCADGIFGYECSMGVSFRIVSMSGEVYVEYSDSLKSSSSTSKEDAASRISKTINKNHKFIQKVQAEIANWML